MNKKKITKGLKDVTIGVYASTYRVSIGSSPDYPPKKWFYSSVESKDGMTVGTEGNETDLVTDVIILTLQFKEENENLKYVKINYKGSLSKIVEIVDGYFGRPAIPIASTGLRNLNRNEIKKFRRSMISQSKKEKRLCELLF